MKQILHCHSTFSLGGKEARAVRLMNAFGDAASHTILSAVPDAMDAREALAPGIKVDFPADAPSLTGKPSLLRYRNLAHYMSGFDLVLSYNWGAMDAVGARRLFGQVPLIHHEDGFNADEVQRLNRKRNAFRQLTLPAAEALVVPSRTLETIARDVWKRPAGRLHLIPNGVDTAAYAMKPAPGSIPGLVREPGDLVIGTLAGLRPVKNLPRLVRAVAALPGHVKLVIVGEGPARDEILSEAQRTGMAERLLLPGFLPQPHHYLGHFDMFALSSDSEQFPISLVEAMAAGLPVAATNVGDVVEIVSDENKRFIVKVSEEKSFIEALSRLVADPKTRSKLGAANRNKAIKEFDEAAMIARYAALYGLA